MVGISKLASCAVWMISMAVAWPAMAAELTTDTVEQATFEDAGPRSGKISPLVIKAQIFLDRARFSPGVIDGLEGENYRQALEAFEKQNGLNADGKLDREVWSKLSSGQDRPALKEYTITEEDVAGPFVEKIPDDFKEMSKLDKLAYSGPEELLAERFHMDEDLLRALNPKADFAKAGAKIIVADPRDDQAKGDVTRIEVDKGEKAVRAFTSDGKLVAFFPATIGSSEKPAPDGTFKVNAVAKNPTYYFDPEKLEFKGVKVDEKLKIAPGPNNPVGSVWIDLSKETYGIHGTPDPSKIGKTFSHGCVRLTNWDAQDLAGRVKAGASVKFIGS